MSNIEKGAKVIATRGKNHIEGEVTYAGTRYLDIEVAEDDVISIPSGEWTVKVAIPAEPKGYFPVVKFKDRVPAVRGEGGRWYFVTTPGSTYRWDELVAHAYNEPFVVLYGDGVDL